MKDLMRDALREWARAYAVALVVMVAVGSTGLVTDWILISLLGAAVFVIADRYFNQIERER